MPAFSDRELELDEVTVNDGTEGVEGEVLDSLRHQTVDFLKHAAKKRGMAGGHAAHIRVRVDVLEHEDDIYVNALQQDGCAFFGMTGVPFGQIISRERLDVGLTLEVDGQSFTGRASVQKYGSLYAPAGRRALASALDQALLDAQHHVRNTKDTRFQR